MTQRNLILATAGHVDHGKTALVKALTGIETDRLPEEKSRGITIEPGFASLDLHSPNESDVYHLGIIDVPGHEDFLRNMLAGLSAIDLALLVVAADDGWMPQTEEHLQILDYLGVSHGVVAVTKCDRADGERVAAEARAKLAGASLGNAEIVLTNTRDGGGVNLLRDALIRACKQIPAQRDIGKPRLFVDRAFTIHGAGTVVTGTLTGGHLRRGETVSIQPQNLRARIRTLQIHSEMREVAEPGSRVALNLPDLRVDQIPRGAVVTNTNMAGSSRVLDVFVRRSNRLAKTAPALPSGAMVEVHHGSNRQLARIQFADSYKAMPREEAIARLSFKNPVFVFAADRFVLRDSSARHTLAGGWVLDAQAAGKKFGSGSQRSFLGERAAGPDDLKIHLRTQLARDKVVPRESLLVKSNFSAAEIAAAIEELARKGAIVCKGELVADSAWWEALIAKTAQAIDAEHNLRPNERGIALAQLRTRLRIRDPRLCAALIEQLCANGFVCEKECVARTSHRALLPPALQQTADAIRAALRAKPFDPPSKKDLLRDVAAQQAMRFLAAQGEVLSLNHEVFLSAEAFAKMREIIEHSLGENRAATASELRQSLGTTRRVLIPLLEYCDRIGLTMRQGDRRVLRKKTKS